MAASLRVSQLKVPLCREYFICAVVAVKFGVCNPVRLLQLHIITIRTWSINLISNPKHRPEPLKHVTISLN
jgi:hypothetical protein